ncbi:MAG: ABC transporter ATP-binding protein [Angelakisella sp.]
MIEFSNISAGYEGREILKGISFTALQGQITTLIGPNGCGKTTLLRAAARQLPLSGGEILLNGQAIDHYERKEFARLAAFMPQVRDIPSITVRALVTHGRFPYLGLSRQLRLEDKEAVSYAMESTGVADWADRDLRELSGGERQRVYIAMVLAQGTEVIFLDEPTTYLDLNHQFELLNLIYELNTRGKTIVMVLHDLSHALRYSHKIALMEAGRLVDFGEPQKLFENDEIGRVFHVHTHKTADGYYFTPQDR